MVINTDPSYAYLMDCNLVVDQKLVMAHVFGHVDFFKNIKGFRNEGLFHANAIVGANNGRAANCDSANGAADAGRRYVEVADRTTSLSQARLLFLRRKQSKVNCLPWGARASPTPPPGS